jgi:two-component system, cell cycle sensor histidine kinase and response regulator CckA
MNRFLLQSLLWRLLLPVMVIGTVSSVGLNYFLVPPIVSTLKSGIDKTINYSASRAVSICEERFNDMLDLRMEENAEMNNASKREAIDEIKEIAHTFHNIRTMVVDADGRIQGASFAYPDQKETDLLARLNAVVVKGSQVTVMKLFGDTVLLQVEYFPFWRWYLVSFIPEKEYLAPILMAKRIVQLGTFGTLLTVVATVLFLFIARINRPLKKLIKAADEVRQGNFRQIGMKGSGEIEQVAVAFDHMVETLAADRRRIDMILQELKESEEQYRILSESSLALVLMLRKDIFLYANKMAASFFNKSPEELTGAGIYSVFKEDEGHIFRTKMQTLEDAGSGVEHFEAPFQVTSGKESWLEILASVITFQKERSILIHAIDITKRKQMEKEQENLQEKIARGERMEILGTLAGGVAHDLNNILGGMVSYPDLLLQGMKEDDKLYKPLQTIYRSGVKAAAVVQDLLTLTRRGVVVTEVVDLSQIIQEYLVSPEFDSLYSFYPGIKVYTDIAPDLMNIKGSHLHLAKSLMNLVTNAAEAMPAGGSIKLEAQNRYVDRPVGSYEDIVEGEYVVLTVSDTGEGISKEDIGKIFEPFYTKKAMGRSGTGLGMSVVWGTVKDHNGYIEVTSEKGRGTTFRLYFPASRKNLAEESASFVIEEKIGRGEKILVIDDVEEQRLIATSMLAKLGYTATAVSSGEEAVDRIQREGFDLLLVDMIMDPGMDGLDTYREILKVNPGQKAIIASGFSETQRVRTAMSLGTGAYVKKPYSMEALAVAVKNELTAKRERGINQ